MGSRAPSAPPPPTPSTSQMLLPVTSPSWEETGSFSFKCLPKKRDGGLNSRSMVSQGGGKRSCIKIRDTFVGFFFSLVSIHHHSLAAGTPGQQQLLTFPSRLPAVVPPWFGSSFSIPPPPPATPWLLLFLGHHWGIPGIHRLATDLEG